MESGVLVPTGVPEGLIAPLAASTWKIEIESALKFATYAKGAVGSIAIENGFLSAATAAPPETRLPFALIVNDETSSEFSFARSRNFDFGSIANARGAKPPTAGEPI